MRIFKSAVIDAPVETVWAVLRCFDGVVKWNPGVVEASIEEGEPNDRVGCIRRLVLPDGGVIRETLRALDDVSRSFTYDIIESPLPVRDYLATQRFHPVTLGGQTFATWEVDFETDPEHAVEMAELVGVGIFENGLKGMQDYFGRT